MTDIGGAGGCIMEALVCVNCGFVYSFHSKVRKDLRNTPNLILHMDQAAMGRVMAAE